MMQKGPWDFDGFPRPDSPGAILAGHREQDREEDKSMIKVK